MAVFKYGEKEIEHLKKKDKKLGAVIDRLGMLEREVDPDLFPALVSSIVAQQISSKAADTVWKRLLAALGEVTPATIRSATEESIQKCGLSMRKAKYIKGIGEAVGTGALKLEELPGLPDEEVVQKLVSLNGIGRWTAEMLMIFSMVRPNVVSWGDFAIRRGMMNVYGLKELTKDQFDKYCKRYVPYGSVASLYLWAASVEKEASWNSK